MTDRFHHSTIILAANASLSSLLIWSGQLPAITAWNLFFSYPAFPKERIQYVQDKRPKSFKQGGSGNTTEVPDGIGVDRNLFLPPRESNSQDRGFGLPSHNQVMATTARVSE